MKSNLSRAALAVLMAGGLSVNGQAALKSAKVSDFEGEVTLSKNGAAAQPVKVDSTVTPSDVVRTGNKSLAELEFNDKTLTRLGSNTIFSYSPQNREFQVESGTALLQVPPGLGGAKIQTAAVTAAITGTTVMVQKLPSGVIKLMVLEGTMNATLKGSNQMRTMKAGDILVIPPNLKTLPQPTQVNVATIMGTSKLIKGFGTKLSSEGKIEKTVDKQKELTGNGGMTASGVVITSSQDLMNLVGNQVLSSATFDTLTQRIVETETPVDTNNQGGGQTTTGFVVPSGAVVTPTVGTTPGKITLPDGQVANAVTPATATETVTLFTFQEPISFTGKLPTSSTTSDGALGLLVNLADYGVGQTAIDFSNTTNGDSPLHFAYTFIGTNGGDIAFNNANFDISQTYFYTGYGYSGNATNGQILPGDINIKNSSLTVARAASSTEGGYGSFYSANKILVDQSTVEVFAPNSSGVSLYSEKGVTVQNSNLVSNQSGHTDFIGITSRGDVNISNSVLGGAGASAVYVAALNNANLTIANSTLRGQIVTLTGATLTISGTTINSPSIYFYTNSFVNGGGNHFSSTPTIQPYNGNY